MLKVHKLKNNITLILDPNENSLITSVLVGVTVGSNNEGTNQHGLAHFLEHMCLKGTKEYPTYHSLDNKIDSLGMYVNGFTSPEMTVYHFIGSAKHIEEMLHLSSEMLINSLFLTEAIEKERGAVIEEIKMREDNSEFKSWKTSVLELLKDTQIGHMTSGSIESVKSFERDDCLEFYQKHYVADNTIIAISGKFDEGATLKKVTEEFKNARRGEKTKPPVLKINKTLGDQFTSISRDGVKQTSVTIAFYSVGEDDEKTEIVKLLSVVLGYGRSSRLYSSLRRGMGVCYVIKAANILFSNFGIFYIETGINSNNFERVIKQIAVECSRLKTELITAEELEKAKQFLIVNILRNTESTIQRADYYLSQYIRTGEVTTIEESINRINKVTATEIQDMATEILKGDEVKIASVGNTKFEDSAVAPLFNI